MAVWVVCCFNAILIEWSINSSKSTRCTDRIDSAFTYLDCCSYLLIGVACSLNRCWLGFWWPIDSLNTDLILFSYRWRLQWLLLLFCSLSELLGAVALLQSFLLFSYELSGDEVPPAWLSVWWRAIWVAAGVLSWDDTWISHACREEEATAEAAGHYEGYIN